VSFPPALAEQYDRAVAAVVSARADLDALDPSISALIDELGPGFALDEERARRRQVREAWAVAEDHYENLVITAANRGDEVQLADPVKPAAEAVAAVTKKESRPA
jgi:hypothetical protein